MDRSKINKNARTINLKGKTDREFFLLHGYTGSPTDFNQLGRYLNKRFKANVKIIRLIGHGEKIENLDKLNYKDFLLQAERELKKDIGKKRKIIIGGLSVGSFIALQLSSKYSVKGVLNISLPYKKRFFCGIISFLEPIIFKKYWKKPFSEHEKKLREKAFFYSTSLLGFKIIRQAKEEIKNKLKKITAPCLIIHVAKDKLFSFEGAKIIREKIKSHIKEIVLFEEKGQISHNPFYSSNHEKIYKIIGDFVEKNKLFA